MDKQATLPSAVQEAGKKKARPLLHGHAAFLGAHIALGLQLGRRGGGVLFSTVGRGCPIYRFGQAPPEAEGAHPRFEVVRDIMERPTEEKQECRESNFGISEEDAQPMKEAGIISAALNHPTTGWAIPFTVVEGKLKGLRRRFIAWPRETNERKDYEASVPLGHVSQYLGAAYDDTAATFDPKASFFQVALPEDVRVGFRCRTESRELVEFTRLPMGFKCSPEILHTVTRALAGTWWWSNQCLQLHLT